MGLCGSAPQAPNADDVVPARNAGAEASQGSAGSAGAAAGGDAAPAEAFQGGTVFFQGQVSKAQIEKKDHKEGSAFFSDKDKNFADGVSFFLFPIYRTERKEDRPVCGPGRGAPLQLRCPRRCPGRMIGRRGDGPVCACVTFMSGRP